LLSLHLYLFIAAKTLKRGREREERQRGREEGREWIWREKGIVGDGDAKKEGDEERRRKGMKKDEEEGRI
jgi:hypothetical protein